MGVTDLAVVKMLTIDEAALKQKRLIIRYTNVPGTIVTESRSQRVNNENINIEVPIDLKGQRITEFVKKLLSDDAMRRVNSRDESSDYQPKEQIAFDDPKAKSLLDLKLEQSSYLVFLLDPNWDWQFSRKGHCFTLSSPNGRARNMYYNDVTHMNRQYETAGQRDDPIGNGCMAVFLRYEYKRLRYTDKFNLGVELLNGAAGKEHEISTGIIIDPDVTNCPTCPPG